MKNAVYQPIFALMLLNDNNRKMISLILGQKSLAHFLSIVLVEERLVKKVKMIEKKEV